MSDIYEGVVRVERLGPRGMVMLRGDLDDETFVSAATAAAKTGFPGQREITLDGDRGLAWMSPDELLVLVPHEEAPGAVTRIEKAMESLHHLAVDVSDARAVFRISGPGAREVIAKGAPVDMHPDSFGPGQIRRTRLGQVAAAFWMTDATTIELVCFRSVSDFVWDWLCHAARPGSLPEYLPA